MELERLEKEREVRTEPEAAPEALKSTLQDEIVKTKPNFGRVDLWSLLGQVSPLLKHQSCLNAVLAIEQHLVLSRGRVRLVSESGRLTP